MLDFFEKIFKIFPVWLLTLWGSLTVLIPVAVVHALSNDDNIALFAIGISVLGTNLTLLGIYLSYRSSQTHILQIEKQNKRKYNREEYKFLRKNTIGASENLRHHKSQNGIYKGGYMRLNSPYKYVAMWCITHKSYSKKWNNHYKLVIYFRALSNREVHEDALRYKSWWDYSVEISRLGKKYGELTQSCNLNRRDLIPFTEMDNYEYACFLDAYREIESLDKDKILLCKKYFDIYERDSITPLLNQHGMQNVKEPPRRKPGEQNVWLRNSFLIRWREVNIECTFLDNGWKVVRIYNPFAEFMHTKIDTTTGKPVSGNRSLQEFDINLEGNAVVWVEIENRLNEIFRGYNSDGSWNQCEAGIADS